MPNKFVFSDWAILKIIVIDTVYDNKNRLIFFKYYTSDPCFEST